MLASTLFTTTISLRATAAAIKVSTHEGNLLAGASLGGQWDLIGHSGVSAMHAIMRPFSEKVLFLERVQESTYAKVKGTSENGNGGDAFAWSTEFSTGDGKWRSLNVQSNMFCSAGGYLPDGTAVSVAGGQPSNAVEQGYDGIRLYKPCNGTQCDWQQNFDVHLQEKRWYPTVEALANGDLFILGGSNHAASINNDQINVPNFELYPPLPGPKKTVDFPFLTETLPSNLYPIVHLLPDKNLFILASTKAIILSTSTWKIIKQLPDIPGPPRNYPLTAGSVLLPLTPENGYEPEVLVCGGATEFSTQAKGVASCGRIAPLSKNPVWEMEDMPFGRMMPDMAHLADGSIAILNGADTGTAGFDRASDPVLHPVQYLPNEKRGSRFRVWNPSVIARMYHSVAFMLPDASLLVAGSNPNGKPVKYGEGPFPTEYRVERFSPPYLFPHSTIAQGEIVAWPTKIHYGETFEISLEWYNTYPENIRVALLQPGFITHSTHMSQRYVGLEIVQRGTKIESADANEDGNADADPLERNKGGLAEAGLVRVKAPATSGLASPSHYMIVVVLDGVPVVEAKWIQLAA
ncbi:glyoxal oxidase N-terminus-domain-containing protein [Gamsiella multidivaricata]|uniref:glyoxal oxidase N-terminus-domain-containing protein n=1 Tax=Gamsiella multidivaricata TaxID=101098 RepID=UPI0022208CA1|nr:glyoxal oxidase N-terminus-domain-containing protein [Gamsiella multidivaricata]KAI7822359.1 glyoxal oxidase N-terminus-domain-containing protein [Gamsiella multidivaricata]